MKLALQMHVAEIRHNGVRLPQEFHDPKGYWRWLPCGGFIAANVTKPKATTSEIDLYRWMAFCAPVEVTADPADEKGRRYLQVPRIYQRLGLLPQFGQNVVLFGGGDWCEIWSVDKWVENMRKTAGDLDNLMAAVKDEFAQR
jgi:hypothetical protein